MPTLLSPLGYTLILIETILSQWGYFWVSSLTPSALVRLTWWISTVGLYYPHWDILWSWLKPYSPNEDIFGYPHGLIDTFCVSTWWISTIGLYYPHWDILWSWFETILSLPFCVGTAHLVNINYRPILTRLGDTFIYTFCIIISMSTILIWLGDNLILVEILFSQWGYPKCFLIGLFGYPHWHLLRYHGRTGWMSTILTRFRRYFDLDWNPILAMRRILIAENRISI